MSAPTLAADAGPPAVDGEHVGYLPQLSQPWDGQYQSGMRTAARGAVTAGAGLAVFGAGFYMLTAGGTDGGGLVIVGALFSVAGGIGLLTGAPMMGFGADRAHRALVRSGIKVTGAPGDLSGFAWLGMMVVNLVNVWGEGDNQTLIVAEAALFLTAYGLAATQMQINSNAYWGRRKVVARSVQMVPFTGRLGHGLAVVAKF